MSLQVVVKGALGLLAAGAISVAMYLRHISAEQIALREETLKMVVGSFKANRLQIIRNLLRLDSVKFDVKTLLAIHKAFSRNIDHREHGVLSYRAFDQILVGLSVSTERLRETIFNLWDQNHDKNVDFVELVEGLSAVCFDNTERVLGHYFNGFDTDGSGDLSKSELRDLVSAMNPFAMEMDNRPIDYLCKVLLQRADKNGNFSISRTEWLDLAGDPSFDLEWTREFNSALCHVFGFKYSAFRPYVRSSMMISSLTPTFKALTPRSPAIRAIHATPADVVGPIASSSFSDPE